LTVTSAVCADAVAAIVKNTATSNKVCIGGLFDLENVEGDC
jgi:hypothetical protein